jgi:hypothetical protein
MSKAMVNHLKMACFPLYPPTPTHSVPPPWYVQYAPELAVVAILASLGVLMYLSPRFREAVKRTLRDLSRF